MKKCCCLIVICQLLISLMAVARSWAEENRVGPTKASFRSAALKTSPPKFSSKNTTPVASPAIARTSATTSGLAIAKEITRQRMELSPQWYLEGDYNYYYGTMGNGQWMSVDRPEIYAVYHMYPFEILTPYFRFGAEWLRQQDVYFYSRSRSMNDAVNLHMGGGLRFGLAKHVALDGDVKYQVPMAGSRERTESWGGSMGILFYF